MKVFLNNDFQNAVAQSGVGRALDHQKLALESAGIPYTTHANDHYDLIQINTIFPQSYLKARRARHRQIPVIYFAHSTEEDFKDSFLFSNQLASAFKWWLKKCYNLGDLILTPSSYSKQLLENYDLAVPIKTISNGIDCSYWTASPEEITNFKKQFHLYDDKAIIISVGLQIKRKGIIEFVELAKRFPNLQFIWFGKTNPHMVPEDVQEALNTKLDNLQFAGYLERDQLRIAYQVADIYLFLTHEETEGIVLLEALASQTPSIISDLPVFDYLTDKEDIYKADSVDSFQKAIQHILNGDWSDLTAKGYQIAQTRDIHTIGQQYKAIYDLAFSLAKEHHQEKN